MGEEARLESVCAPKAYRGFLQRSPFGRIPIRDFKQFLVFMSYYVYILQSKSHLTYYYGHCANLDKRISEHNNGKVRYSKGRRPWVLHYFEQFKTRSDAVRRERFFKSIEGYKYLKEKEII